MSEPQENLEVIVRDVTTQDIPLHIQEEMLAVLRKFAELGVIGPACDKSGVRRKSHVDWLSKYPQYKEVYNELRERFVDGLEVVAIARAKEKSDSLLSFLLKSYRRDQFGDQSRLDLHGQQGGGITLLFADGMLNEEEKKIMNGGEVDAKTETP